MVSLAREREAEAEMVLGSAEQLPFRTHCSQPWRCRSSSSSCPTRWQRFAKHVASRRRPVAIAICTTSPKLRGTPAAPEPLGTRSHFYDNAKLVALADTAGFDNIAVSDRDGGQLLTANT